MNNFHYQWKKLGCIIKPTGKDWLYSHAGSSYALQVGNTSLFDIYITGRDQQNRSLIGRVRIDIHKPTTIIEQSKKPVLDLGALGSFDENGTSYPWFVTKNNRTYMYYTGWTPTVLTPFQNFVGIAAMKGPDQFERLSPSPVLPRDQNEYLGSGSVCVLYDNNRFRMWYTCYQRWEKTQNQLKHYYLIKYAESKDGLHWERNNHICVDFENNNEYAICRPSVVKIKDLYHMWYCYRGEQYRLGYAISNNGMDWQRRDDAVGISYSPSGWDSKTQCYPHVFQFQNQIYMLYCGNDYGAGGLGLAMMMQG